MKLTQICLRLRKSNNKVSKVLLLIKLRLQYICTFFSELKTAKHYTLLTVPRHATLRWLVWFGFGLSLSRQIWISITVMRYQKKNNCKSPNFTALKTMIYIFYKKTHYHKKNNNKVFKFLPQKSHNKYRKSRLTFEKSCEKTVMKKKPNR